MTSKDVLRTKDKAMKNTRLTYQNPPKLLSDNGPCYIASWLKKISVANIISSIFTENHCIRRRREKLNAISRQGMGYGEKIKKIREIRKQNQSIIEF